MPGTALYDGQGNLVATFGTIQQAVDAAQDGYTVQLADGTYREQVSVTDKTITIKGNGEGRTTIESPDATALNANTAYRGSAAYSIIGVKSSTRTTGLTIQNLTIDGRNQGSVGDSNGLNFDGIGGTNANISADSVAIQNVRKLTNGALNGNQRNTGIIVDNSDGAARTFSLTNSTVSAFQKNGLTLNGAGLTVNVRGNTITGAGATEALAQNGIQVSRGATGMIANNNLTGIDYTLGSLASQDQANSILAFGAGSNLAITNNTITGATDGNGQGNAGQVGIYFTDTDSGAVTGNTIKNMMPSIVETGSFTTPLQLNGTSSTRREIRTAMTSLEARRMGPAMM